MIFSQAKDIQPNWRGKSKPSDIHRFKQRRNEDYTIEKPFQIFALEILAGYKNHRRGNHRISDLRRIRLEDHYLITNQFRTLKVRVYSDKIVFHAENTTQRKNIDRMIHDIYGTEPTAG